MSICAEDGGGEGEGDGEAGAGPKRRRRVVDLNPDATLESSLSSLNVKKYDLAFDVDPLFHKTSAQFDEGGAKGVCCSGACCRVWPAEHQMPGDGYWVLL